MTEQTPNMRHHTRKGKSNKMRRQIQAMRRLEKHLKWLQENGQLDSEEFKRVDAEKKTLESKGVAGE